MTALICAAALVVVAILVSKLLAMGRRDKAYPPGPDTIPVLGNAHQFPTKWAHIKLTEWTRIYGDIYSLMIGPGVITVIASYAAVKELLDKQTNITGDRPQSTIGDTVTGGVHMAQAHDQDPIWSELRKAARGMMTVASCQKYLPIQRAESMQFMYDILKRPQKFDDHARRYTYSVIASVVYGCRFPRFSSKECTDFYHVTGLWSRLMEPGRHPPVDLIPILKYVPKRFALWKREAAVVRDLQQKHYFGLLERVQKRLKNGEPNGCFMEKVVEDESLSMTQEKMAYLGGVLLEGGADTTSSYLKTLHLAMVAYPDAQRKAHEELDRVVGSDRLPQLDDMDNLPYIRAVIREAQRWRPAAPLSLPHATTEEATYRGYVIPTGATILLNVWAISHDEELFERPNDFWPDRYIKEQFGTRPGVDVSAFRHTLAYGSGKRICPGINLATNSVELNTMLLLWAFDFNKAIDNATRKVIEPDVDNYSEGLFTAPLPFQSDIKPRSAHHAEMIEYGLRDAAPIFERYELELVPEDAKYVKKIRGVIDQL